MSDKTFKIWYIAIVVIAFAFLNLILMNGIIRIGNWFKWIAIIIDCFIMGMAAWKIITQYIKLKGNA